MPMRPAVHRPPGWKPRKPWAKVRDANPLPRNWTRIRTDQLRREPLCRACSQHGRVTAATEVDHIVPRANGGGSEGTNLQSLCHDCHVGKTLAEQARGGQGAHA